MAAMREHRGSARILVWFISETSPACSHSDRVRSGVDANALMECKRPAGGTLYDLPVTILPELPGHSRTTLTQIIILDKSNIPVSG